jgi:uncharacterized protein (DUF3820 family)
MIESTVQVTFTGLTNALILQLLLHQYSRVTSRSDELVHLVRRRLPETAHRRLVDVTETGMSTVTRNGFTNGSLGELDESRGTRAAEGRLS